MSKTISFNNNKPLTVENLNQLLQDSQIVQELGAGVNSESEILSRKAATNLLLSKEAGLWTEIQAMNGLPFSKSYNSTYCDIYVDLPNKKSDFVAWSGWISFDCYSELARTNKITSIGMGVGLIIGNNAGNGDCRMIPMEIEGQMYLVEFKWSWNHSTMLRAQFKWYTKINGYQPSWAGTVSGSLYPVVESFNLCVGYIGNA